MSSSGKPWPDSRSGKQTSRIALPGAAALDVGLPQGVPPVEHRGLVTDHLPSVGQLQAQGFETYIGAAWPLAHGRLPVGPILGRATGQDEDLIVRTIDVAAGAIIGGRAALP